MRERFSGRSTHRWQLAAHAEALAAVIRAHAAAYARAKLPADTPDRLAALAALLREHQGAWTQARAATFTDALREAREDAVESRGEVFAALRWYGRSDGDLQKTLDFIAEDAGDADTVSDLTQLIPLARAHAASLVGSDLPPEKVALAATRLETFKKLLARGSAGAEVEGADESSLATVSKEATAALRLRNRVFWALSALDREAAAGGRYVFRNDARLAAQFTSYVPRAAKKKPAEG